MQKYFNNILYTVSGVLQPVAGALVTVNQYPSGSPATIYSDNGITPLGSNILTTDAKGYFEFYAANGRYQLVVAGTGIIGYTINDILLEDFISSGLVNSFNTRTGIVSLSSGDISAALGYTPLAGNQTISLTGDASGSGTTSIGATLATVNSSPGSYGSSTVIPVFTVDAKGRITAIGTANIPAAGSGTVTSVSVVNANGFTATIPNPTGTPAITLKTTVSGLLKGNSGTGVVSAAASGTDFGPTTSALASGIVYSTTSTGAHTIAPGGYAGGGNVYQTPLPTPVSQNTKIRGSDGTNDVWVTMGNWFNNPVVLTGNTTVTAGSCNMCNTTSASFTVTLPASPVSTMAPIYFGDYAGNWATNNLIIAGNGANIEGSASNLTCNLNRDSFWMAYIDVTQGWKVI